MMEIVQIVSRLPPAIDGVGDYAYLLARQLRKAHGINTQFVVCDPNWENTEILKAETMTSDLRLDGFSVYQLREQTAADLLRVLSAPGMPSTVLLQYVGYGYEKRGCPVWLVHALSAWKSAGANAEILKPETLKRKGKGKNSISEFQLSAFSFQPPRRLLTMFHELYASGPPWRSSFWTSPVQRWIAKSLARSSEDCSTNRAASATWLAAASHRAIATIPVLPVFSNLDEPETILPLLLRKPQMLIYGGLSRSANDRDLAKKAINQACTRLGIERVVAFGSKSLDPASFGFPVENIGLLTGKHAGKLLSESRAGYLDYFDGYLAKSGIFAAYCAYGLVPLLLCKNGSDADGLKMGSHFLAASALPEEVGVEAQQRIADQAREWYSRHSVKEVSCHFADKLKPETDRVKLPVEK